MRTIDWLVIGIIVVIVLLLADGMRRKWRDRHNRVVMKIDRKNIPPPQDDEDQDPFPSSELPNGGARTKTRDGQAPAPAPRVARTAAGRSRVASEAEAAVPLLIDSVELEEEDIEHTNVYSSGDEAEQFDADDFDEAAEYQEDEDFDEEDDEDWDEEGEEEAERATAWQDRDDEDYEDDDEDFGDEDDFSEEDDYPEEDLPEDEDQDEAGFDQEDLDEADFDEEELDEEELDEGALDDESGDESEEDVEEGESWEDDYESEPALLEGAYHKAATHFQRPDDREERVEPGFGEDDLAESFDPEEFTEDFSGAIDEVSDEPAEQLHAESRAAPKAREPQPEAPREKRSFFSRTLGRQDQAELFRQEAAKPEVAEEPVEAPQEVIILNVMARPGSCFEGNELLPVLQEQGLRLGDMSIFHLHGPDHGKQVMFSMANMVKPGTFDLASMDDFTTPGVSFFLQMPNRNGNMASFERMLRTATTLKQALDGELKDEHRSVCTQQTIEHNRQRIRDFELARLTRR
jgi:cell division protein ZipA